MITGVHGLIFTTAAEELREFLRDKLGLPAIDSGGGWLIFKLPPAELGVHPFHESGMHAISFMCDDLAQTTAELKAKGVEFGEPREEEFGRLAEIKLPGGGEITLYEPRHVSPLTS